MNAPIWVLGAGAIGLFVGGRLAAAGANVHFIGRARLRDEIAQAGGLLLTDLEGPEHRLAALQWHEAEPPGVPGLVLLCVKSGATASALADLALPSGTPVLSLQNGVDNARLAQQVAPQARVLAGMVPFNVAHVGPGHWHRGSSGQLAAQDAPALQPWQALFERAALPLQLHRDMSAVQWAKLLLNLNNPVNALSGLPLRAQLLNADWRACTAALMAEALQVLRAAGIRPARLTPLPPGWLPALMRLPTPLFERLAARMLRIDAQARSSMADDLAAGRPTEIDALCGAVLRLAQAQGLQAPRQRLMVELLSAAQPQPLSAQALRQRLGA
ncbi:MAG: 2-dehydropantoate 2-reductase [Inhella sp.]